MLVLVSVSGHFLNNHLWPLSPRLLRRIHPLCEVSYKILAPNVKSQSHSSCLLPRWFQFVSSLGFFFLLVPIFVTSLVHPSLLFYLINSNNFEEYKRLFHLLFYSLRYVSHLLRYYRLLRFSLCLSSKPAVSKISKSQRPSLIPSVLHSPKDPSHYVDSVSTLLRIIVLQNLRRGPLERKQNVVVWHEVISNSLAKHQNNNYASLSPEELIQLLFEFRNRICAIVYVQRSGSPNILKKLFFIWNPHFRRSKLIVVSTKTKDSFCHSFVR